MRARSLSFNPVYQWVGKRLDKIEDFKEKYNNFKLGDKFPYYPTHEIVKSEDVFNLGKRFK